MGVIEADIAAEIRRLTSEIGQLLAKLDSTEKALRAATSVDRRRLHDRESQAARIDKQEWTELQRRRSDLAQLLAARRQKMMTLRSLRYGEKDAYVLFRARTKLPFGNSSWETLAAMQHYGAPTRLLDWTDALAVAVYFATKQFRLAMVQLRGSIPNWLENHAEGPDLSAFQGLPEPAIWILNPFRLARFAIGKNAVEDLSLRPDLDYFDCFHMRYCWPFPYAMPTTLPWRTPRMEAQRGYFTVHGTDVRALEQQVHKHFLDGSTSCKDPIIAKVTLTPPAAVFAVRYVVQFVGLDSFSMFRDEDNLGATLREFMHRSKRKTRP
jgi:hypothetical protein